MNFILQFLFFVAGSVIGEDFYDWDKEIQDSGLQYQISLHEDPVLLISKNKTLAVEAVNMESNNNVAAKLFRGRLYVGWRTAPVHFASVETRLHIVSSGNNGSTWEYEQTIFLGSDLREPFFVEAEGNLLFYFFQGGSNPLDFEPKALYQMLRLENGLWTEPVVFGHEGEVIWEVVEHNGTLYSQSYSGDYSTPGDAEDLGKLFVFFNRIFEDKESGLTEIGFQFDLEGNLWGVGRNEDGDDSGWGSRLFTASRSNLSNWIFLEQLSNPNIFESPKMFRHGGDLFLVARTDPDGQFWSRDNPLLNTLPAWDGFSLRQHGTGIWKLNTETGSLEQVLTLAGCGDTAFPSIVRKSRHAYIIFNYSSTLEDNCPHNWIMGQISPAGSVIYMQEIVFEVQTD
ncbi:uncharacterized protein LOC111702671 [Eurytemora carolleeae]|uniref:uncharacterized protein LOC111702671 n=1 Tax=Eurytemora carolleeae TaxID=1294199 RepID=UPI000C78F3EE|nr:uncharacterized protein LOC111702671 [Eurytemora carolleeae]|eukprot:XP_023330192.1 uncharacterized protein LOC111702671 [Eurytemora affinis]